MSKNYNLLQNKIFINVNNGKFYIIFGNFLYQFNGDIFEYDNEDINILLSKDFITIGDLDIPGFLDYLIKKVDIYEIINNSEFCKRGRFIQLLKGHNLTLGIVTDIKTLDNKTEIDNIASINLLLENGEYVEIHKDYLANNIRPVENDIDIQIDQMTEILGYYNLDTIDINISQFII